MNESPVLPLTVFYDGGCSICAAEISRYRSQQSPERLIFVDISAADFDPAAYGLTREAVEREMHAIDGDGVVYTGVAAFTAIWRVVPGLFYSVLAEILDLPGISLLARLGYRVFARYRYLLPRRTPECADESCNLGHRKK
jgi:predicted DCC family thiol-disulfide oxidoreductase YuxK